MFKKYCLISEIESIGYYSGNILIPTSLHPTAEGCWVVDRKLGESFAVRDDLAVFESLDEAQ